ncbi:aromatic acid exporter family protein [Phycicoccus sp. M110.8]|uniref:FUSC family protein n=1 Tax=Phycicoccus sp. M110.8 TaxID=3075433 RepID=UPI0028FD47FB|nr:aromatic acid exporter family protein [Phycicoccus sp. M110.8]MDU0312887.1 aromatic acid exporter family protein [Phycicoccus sp. M110.8]
MANRSRVRAGLSAAADRAWPGRPTRWRDVPARLRPTGSWVLRLTSAAVVAWLIARQVTGISVDLTAPLTALLVVQASAFSTLRMSLLRVGAVLTGVLVAVGFSSLAGLSWWSLAAVIAASLFLARVFRLGEQALEVPISAMLILAVGSPDVAAEARVALTLVGAAVGVLFNLVLPSAVPTGRAGVAVLRVAYATADCLDGASRSMATERLRRAEVERWADETRGVASQVAEASTIVTQVKEGRRFNPRALTTADVEPGLREGLDRLEATVLAIRALFTVILAELPPDEDERAEEHADDAFDEDARLAFSVVLADIGDCLRAYGRLVHAEAGGAEERAEEALAESLEILRETRAILTELLTSRPEGRLELWLLRGSVLAAVEQVLVQLDLERRARLRAAWQRPAPIAVVAPLVREALPRARVRRTGGWADAPDAVSAPTGRDHPR